MIKTENRIEFTKEMKKDYKILVPMMAPIHFEILKDIFLWTDTDKILNPSSQIYGGFKSDQEAFDTALEQLGLL